MAAYINLITKTDEESFAPVPQTQKTLDMKDWLIAVFISCKYKVICRIPPNIFTDFINRPLLKSINQNRRTRKMWPSIP